MNAPTAAEVLSTARVRALQLWFAALPPQEARQARNAARACINCTHFHPHNPLESSPFGTCCAQGPTMLVLPHGDMAAMGARPIESAWPVTNIERRCGRWEDPVLPLTWSSPLSGVELERAATKMGAEVAEHV